MPVMGGIDATAELKRRHPEVVVVALTTCGEVGAIAAMLKAGASGYVGKGDGQELVRHLRQMAAATRARRS